MYLAGCLKGRTTLLLTGRSIGLLGASCHMARMLAPSLVVLEDVDLVAEERTRQNSCDNSLLFELLNEMDGMSTDTDVIFLLTTNRPDVLEPALAARPGRIDMAVEIGLPDADGRRRLLDLYRQGLPCGNVDWDRLVSRTEGTSGAFIRELLRRSALIAADSNDGKVVTQGHVDEAMHELLVWGGAVTRRLLGVEKND
jgi:ATP-dependent 26S proteasome regulatory subunit